MSDTPKNADIAIEYFTLAKELGSYEEANKHFQFKDEDDVAWNIRSDSEPLKFFDKTEYRRKPETHIVNGHEVPAPYREAPKFGEVYYCIDIVDEDLIENNAWDGDDFDLRCLRRNNCFKSYSDANENYLAMLKRGKYSEANESYISGEEYAVKVLKVLVNDYTKKLSEDFSEVGINLINKGMGYIHPESVLEFAREIESGEFVLGSTDEVKS